MKKYVFGALMMIFTTIQTGMAVNLDDYNVIWDTQSKDSSESMPVGGHDIGLNVWVEDGDILFYVQRTGSFSENNEYFKLGRVRLKLTHNPFGPNTKFKQELKLKEGRVEITGVSSNLSAKVLIWVDVFKPIVHVDIDASQAIALEADYEGWRNQDFEIKKERFARATCYSYERYDGEVISYKDVVDFDDDKVFFYHRNKDDKLIFDVMLKQRGWEKYKDKMVDTQKGRTFGGYLACDNLFPAGTGTGYYVKTAYKSWRLKSKKAQKNYNLKLFTHVAQTKSLKAWQKGLDKLVKSESKDPSLASKKSLEWWNKFWNRSWLVINPENPNPKDKAWQVGRNYQLFRYQMGCNAFGDYPTKFNGGNFTYDPFLIKSHGLGGISRDLPLPYNPDFRLWGGGSFTAQNQRLLYWPMLKTGDFGLMPSQFDFYDRALPNAKICAKDGWGVEGCIYGEQLENFGMPAAANITEENDESRQLSGQLEFSYMIMEYHRYTGKDISKYMDFIKSSVNFLDNYFRARHKKDTGKELDESGKLVLYPTQACESYRGATNSTVTIAGLRACLSSITNLPKKYISSKERIRYTDFLNSVPDYGYGEVKGDKIMQAAWSWTWWQVDECPQFYPLFPFNQFEIGDGNIKLWRDTWKHGKFWKNVVQSWHQDGIFYARMGMTKEAKNYNTKKIEDSGRRFPTFWGPGCDWVPDHNWAGSGMIGIQEMLMQTIGKNIRLLPAWPKEWNVDFKLHAPFNTTVEGKVRDGKVLDLKVTPVARKKDVIICPVK